MKRGWNECTQKTLERSIICFVASTNRSIHSVTPTYRYSSKMTRHFRPATNRIGLCFPYDEGCRACPRRVGQPKPAELRVLGHRAAPIVGPRGYCLDGHRWHRQACLLVLRAHAGVMWIRCFEAWTLSMGWWWFSELLSDHAAIKQVSLEESRCSLLVVVGVMYFNRYRDLFHLRISRYLLKCLISSGKLSSDPSPEEADATALTSHSESRPGLFCVGVKIVFGVGGTSRRS